MRADLPSRAAVEPAVLRYGEHPEQFIQVWPWPGAARRAVVALLHGGYWRAYYGLDYLREIAEDLHRHGAVVFNIEYRRVGQPGGGWPGTFDDVRAALRFVTEHATRHGGDPAQLVLMGHSAGGQLALWSAGTLDRPPALVVSLAGVCDLGRAAELGLSDNAVAELLGGSPERHPLRYRQVDPAVQRPLAGGARQLLVHGTEDTAVPIELSTSYARRARALGADCSLLLPDGADHFDVVTPSHPVWPTLRERVLDAASGASSQRRIEE